METKKIGDVNFGDFKTEFFLTFKVEEFLKKEKTSLACLLPEGWIWYEVILFDIIDKDGDGFPDEKYGKNFKVIYQDIFEKIELKNRGKFRERQIFDKFLTSGSSAIRSSTGKELFADYVLLLNNE